MKVSKFALCLLIVATLVACVGGPRVVDNTYQSAGMPNFTISKDLQYLGSPYVVDSSQCTGADCGMFAAPNGKVTGDLFARAEDGKLKEIVVLERSQAPARYFWLPLKGPKIDFGGKQYAEHYAVINDKQQGRGYTQLIESSSIGFDCHPMVIRTLIRNVSQANQLYVAYGCSEDMIPEDLRDDSEARKEYLINKFNERIVLPE